ALGVLILGILGLGFVYSQPPAQLSPAAVVAVGLDGMVRIPLASFQGTALHRFQLAVRRGTVRFIAIPIEAGGRIATAFAACTICGPTGYYQDGKQVICLHCGSAIYPPSIGQAGGCNPVPLPSRTEGGNLVLAASDLARGGALFGGTAPAHAS